MVVRIVNFGCKRLKAYLDQPFWGRNVHWQHYVYNNIFAYSFRDSERVKICMVYVGFVENNPSAGTKVDNA